MERRICGIPGIPQSMWSYIYFAMAARAYTALLHILVIEWK